MNFGAIFIKRIQTGHMRLHFETTQWLPYPTELVFAFFANPENLPRLMPRWQRPRIEEAVIAPPPPRPSGAPRYPGMAAGDGTRLILTVRPFPYSPIRLPWEALIENFRWNQGFCDVQMRGPFRYWRHCHSVEAAQEPPGVQGLDFQTCEPLKRGTLLRDQVEYELPLGPFSAIANRLIVHRQLAATFRYRQKRTLELLALATGRKI